MFDRAACTPVEAKDIFFFSYVLRISGSNTDTGSTRWLNANAVFSSVTLHFLFFVCFRFGCNTTVILSDTHFESEQGLPAEGIRQANVTTAPVRANSDK